MTVSVCPQKPGVFDDDLVSSQLKHSGVLETIRIRRQGYPVRMLFCEFLFRYGTHKHSKYVLGQEGSNSGVNVCRVLILSSSGINLWWE